MTDFFENVKNLDALFWHDRWKNNLNIYKFVHMGWQNTQRKQIWAGNALERVQWVHEPADLQDITFGSSSPK